MQKYISQRAIRVISGLNMVEFDALVKSFHTAWIDAETRRPTLSGTERRRALGAGRNATLRTSRDKLLFILLWFKVYPTFDALAFFFGMSQPQACVWAHRLFPILETGYTQLGSTVLLPNRKPHRRKTPKRDKMFNRRLAKRRIVVEHAIAGIKRSRICSDILRAKKPDLPDKIMLVGCALHNFRVDSRTAA